MACFRVFIGGASAGTTFKHIKRYPDTKGTGSVRRHAHEPYCSPQARPLFWPGQVIMLSSRWPSKAENDHRRRGRSGCDAYLLFRRATRTLRRRQVVLLFSCRSYSLSAEVALGLGERISGGTARLSRDVLLLALTLHGWPNAAAAATSPVGVVSVSALAAGLDICFRLHVVDSFGSEV